MYRGWKGRGGGIFTLPSIDLVLIGTFPLSYTVSVVLHRVRFRCPTSGRDRRRRTEHGEGGGDTFTLPKLLVGVSMLQPTHRKLVSVVCCRYFIWRTRTGGDCLAL